MSQSPYSGTSTPKIAIKGFSLSSKSSQANNTLKSNKPPQPSSSLGKRPRSTFATAHDEDDSDSENEARNGRHEAVTGFGAEGAIREQEKKREGPLVIPRLENKGLGLGAKRAKGSGKNLLPPEVQAQREAEERERNGHANGSSNGAEKKEVVSGDAGIAWGLTLTKREKNENESQNGDQEVPQAAEESSANGAQVDKQLPPPEPRTIDQEALDALLGNNEKKGPDLVIPSSSTDARINRISETDAYRNAISSAPDVSTLEDYDRVPVEEFGAALLRGMGWNGEKRGVVRDVKKRQNLLGLGAKELKDAEELGAWVQKSDVKRLNEKRGGTGGSGGERRPKASEYKREKERREERREERGGGSYRRERERERDDSRRDREKDRERERYRERDRDDYRRR